MQAKTNDSGNLKFVDDGFGAFIEAIRDGNVLLMVGHSFEARETVFNGDFYDYILRELNKVSGTEGLDFEDLSHDNRFLSDKDDPHHTRILHEEIVRLVEQNEYTARDDVSEDLLELIKTGYFRFVFTTSFDPLVELAMRERFKTVRVLNIYDKEKRNILSKDEFDIPTVYYLFGKAEFPRDHEPFRKFVATDNDALEVMKKWQLEMGNSTLLQYTSDKYILTLGCTQEDWLFRFIWYMLKGDSSRLAKGVIGGFDESKSLYKYLKNNKILINNDSKALVGRILKVLETREDTGQWFAPPPHFDVFISYSRADADAAQQLYDSLSAKGLSVWYDKMNLAGTHGGFFLSIIKEAIDTSILFIALLSRSISAQSRQVHVYRREWEWAKELKLGLTADCRCFAAVSSDYDIYGRKYPDSLGWLAETDNYIYDASNPSFDDWADTLQKKVVEIKTHGNQ